MTQRLRTGILRRKLRGRVVHSRPLHSSQLVDFSGEEAMEAVNAVKAALAAGWALLMTPVSKKVAVVGGGNEYQEVGKIGIPIPTLEAFGVQAEKRERKEEDGEDDGLPLYKDDKMDWLFGAVVAAAKMQARNKLIPGTADLKDNNKIAQNFEELTAESERRGNAEALKLAKEMRTAFASYVQTLGKTTQTQAVLIGLFGNKQALSLQADDKKAKFKDYLSKFAETLEEADIVRYQKGLTAIEEACAAGQPTDF